MTETPVPKLVLQLGLPTTISMLITNLYSMADTYFVSDLGISQSGAVGIVFALMAIIQAFGFMFGHGAGSIIGRLLGNHEIEEAKKYSATSFYVGIATGLCITVLGLLFWEPFMRLLGSTDTIMPYAKEYSLYVLLAAPMLVISCIMNNILRYEGKAAFSMCGLVSGAVLNIFGDYLLIRVFKLGVAGAGISTAVSQCISAFVLFLPFLQKKVQSSLSPVYFTFNIRLIFEIIAVGFPSLVRQGLNSISVMLLNKACKPYGDEAIAAMGIVARVMSFLFCVGLGIGQGFQPVCGFNYGAKKYKRVKSAYWFTTIFGMCFLGFMAAMGLIFTEPIVTLFRKDPEVIAIASKALRYQCLTLVFVTFTVSGNMLFQSTGKSGRAIFLSSARSGLFYIPTIIILSKMMGLTGIEISQSIADVVAAFVTIPFVLQFLGSMPKEE